jgi:hypothetical protein
MSAPVRLAAKAASRRVHLDTSSPSMWDRDVAAALVGADSQQEGAILRSLRKIRSCGAQKYTRVHLSQGIDDRLAFRPV